jgi:ElaB/YqjD/DUF883 family membrane-anchored ribosome-binding protein
MTQTRRSLIKALTGALAGGGLMSGDALAATPTDTINMDKGRQINHHQNMKREGYTTLPGLCFTTLFSHLPQLLNHGRQQPVIFVDTYDYERVRGQAVQQRDNEYAQIRWLVTETLRQQEIIQTIDYSRFYSASNKERYLRSYREALESLPEHTNQRIASAALDGYAEFGRGEYARSFREALGNWDINKDKLGQLRSYQDRIERGLDDPIQFNEDLAAQYLAALAVREGADQHFDEINVVGALGQGEQESIARVLREADVGIADDVLGLSSGGQSLRAVGRAGIEETASNHRVFEAIETAAREATDVQHNNWFALGPRLAVPVHSSLFARTQPSKLEQDPKEVVEETKAILDRLDQRAETNQMNHVRYRAEQIAEEHETTNQTTDEIEKQLKEAANLANFADDIYELRKTGDYSAEALFAAAAIKTDPHHRQNTDAIFRRTVSLRRRLSSVTVPDHELTAYFDRADFKRQEKDRSSTNGFWVFSQQQRAVSS